MDPLPTTTTDTAIADLSKNLQLTKAIAAAIREKDYAKLASFAPEIADELKADVIDVQAALPEIKAGYKTTEFWLTAGLGILNAIWLAWKGVPLPTEVNAAVASLVGVYTVMRGIVKKPVATTSTVTNSTPLLASTSTTTSSTIPSVPTTTIVTP